MLFRSAVATFMVFPVIATLIQGGAYGISLIWPYTVLSLLLIYFKVQHKRVEMERMQKFEEKERVARLENELVQSNIAIMLSQIQPHFLYNALQGIGYLCRVNPTQAEQAVMDFAIFLRGNMDALSHKGTIPFEQELIHTQHYLDLEKMRFEERLNIKYDIGVSSFELPPLTLQPIVEIGRAHV